MSKMPKKFKDIVGTVYNTTEECCADIQKAIKPFKSTGLCPFITGISSSQEPTYNPYPLMAALDKDGFIVSSDKNDEVTIAVLGKGVIYDTGGYDRKHQMLDMHGDKAGALAVLATAKTFKNDKKVEFVGGFVINKDAVVPGTIIKTRSGKRVEIQNTDAEGRLVLADLIEDVQKTFPKLKHIITIATLTGVKVVALGSSHAAFLSENEALRLKVFKEEKKLRLHPLPIPNDRECVPYNTKRIGVDIPNIDNSRDLGHVKAYKFLRYFVKKGIQLHHIDMAGNELDKNRNPTGFGVEQLEFLIRNLK